MRIDSHQPNDFLLWLSNFFHLRCRPWNHMSACQGIVRDSLGLTQYHRQLPDREENWEVSDHLPWTLLDVESDTNQYANVTISTRHWVLNGRSCICLVSKLDRTCWTNHFDFWFILCLHVGIKTDAQLQLNDPSCQDLSTTLPVNQNSGRKHKTKQQTNIFAGRVLLLHLYLKYRSVREVSEFSPTFGMPYPSDRVFPGFLWQGQSTHVPLSHFHFHAPWAETNVAVWHGELGMMGSDQGNT